MMDEQVGGCRKPTCIIHLVRLPCTRQLQHLVQGEGERGGETEKGTGGEGQGDAAKEREGEREGGREVRGERGME